MREMIADLRAAPVTRFGLYCLAILAAVIIVDQATKAWVLYGLRLLPQETVKILPFFSFTFVQNRSMSFGLLPSGQVVRWLLTVFQLVAGLGLGYAMIKQAKRLPAVALGLIAGGAIGNAIDRIRFGSVVDFLDFSGTHVFPWVFNVADSGITIGVALLGWYFLRSEQAAAKQTGA